MPQEVEEMYSKVANLLSGASAIWIVVDVKWHSGRLVCSSPSAEAGLFSHKPSCFSVRQTSKVTIWKWGGAAPHPSVSFARLKNTDRLTHRAAEEEKGASDQRKWIKTVGGNERKRKTLCSFGQIWNVFLQDYIFFFSYMNIWQQTLDGVTWRCLRCVLQQLLLQQWCLFSGP